MSCLIDFTILWGICPSDISVKSYLYLYITTSQCYCQLFLCMFLKNFLFFSKIFFCSGAPLGKPKYAARCFADDDNCVRFNDAKPDTAMFTFQ